MILRSHIPYRIFKNGVGIPLTPNANGSSAAWPLPAIIVNPTMFPAPAMLVVNNGSADVMVRFGADASIHAGPNMVGMHNIPAGRAVLFDESETGSVNAKYIGVYSPSSMTSKLTIYRGGSQKLVLFEDLGATPDPTDLLDGAGGLYPVVTPVTTDDGHGNTTTGYAPAYGTPS